MTTTSASLSKRELKDLMVLAHFTAVYCRAHHGGRERRPCVSLLALVPGSDRHPVCAECGEFLVYAADRRIKCPLEPKPSCKHCPIHCYRPGHRERVREIMRFSGRHLLLRGRLDLLWHYFF